jgi:hypothetical protein
VPRIAAGQRQIVRQDHRLTDSGRPAICAPPVSLRHVSHGEMMGRMADSDAVRSQRKRAHARGDHHLCRHRVDPSPAPDPSLAGEVFDPAGELVALARRLAAASAADPANANLAKKLRQTLTVIPPAEAPSTLEALRQRRWLKLHGWAPGDDPELRVLAAAMDGIDPVEVLRDWASETP